MAGKAAFKKFLGDFNEFKQQFDIYGPIDIVDYTDRPWFSLRMANNHKFYCHTDDQSTHSVVVFGWKNIMAPYYEDVTPFNFERDTMGFFGDTLAVVRRECSNCFPKNFTYVVLFSLKMMQKSMPDQIYYPGVNKPYRDYNQAHKLFMLQKLK